MRDDYVDLLKMVRSCVFNIGGVLNNEGDLYADFVLSDGWKILFECERYYGPSFLIYIVSPEDEKYEIGLLMLAHRDMYGVDLGLPTINAQLDFIEKYNLIKNIDEYKKEYARLSRID